ncbi:division/cell wall cluster transcriptional repressor MraZ [Dokdonella sp.]|uniref:division/cell wall cluster transcriptional repressor MraZ n=1 Tax=Dokdonella sp. TaxID=2291710 RepID=UPI0037834FA9
MFQGETAVTLDDKGRVAIPAAHRDLVAKSGNRLVVTYNPFEHGCLWLFPQAEWERVRDVVNGLSSMVAVHRNLQRKLVGAAAALEPDANGRIQLPASMRSQSALEKRAVLLGMGNKLELWSEQAHLATIRETIGEAQITEDMLELTL